jgi:malonyl CoA-acyl carrier protein transacylase
MRLQEREMPHYFFNLQLEDQTLADHEGQHFPNADAAWEAARAAARDLMGTAIVQPVDWQKCYFAITDNMGEIVMEFPFLEAIDLPKSPN